VPQRCPLIAISFRERTLLSYSSNHTFVAGDAVCGCCEGAEGFVSRRLRAVMQALVVRKIGCLCLIAGDSLTVVLLAATLNCESNRA
jgi:hypothetical protein